MSEEFDPPLTLEAEAAIQKHDRRSEQNLDYYPFSDGLGNVPNDVEKRFGRRCGFDGYAA